LAKSGLVEADDGKIGGVDGDEAHPLLVKQLELLVLTFTEGI